jgi:hypothetical protein
MTAAECVRRFVEAFQRLQIPFMVVGSFSSNIYGFPRSTKDADFVVQTSDDTLTRLAAEIGQGFRWILKADLRR